MVKLSMMCENDAQHIREWRNVSIQNARTPFLLTYEMQRDWYREVVCNRDSVHRYWSVMHDCGDGVSGKPAWHLSGVAGLTDIDGRVRTAEVALMVAPELRGRGIGGDAFALLLDQAFGVQNLETVFGECYLCNESLGFWKRQVEKWRGHEVYLPKRQYWDGRYWDSYWFCIDRSEWVKKKETLYVPAGPWTTQRITVTGDPNF